MGLLPNLGLFAFSIVSTLSQPFFTSFEPLPPALIEWDQTNTTYYTGQTMTMSWDSQNFLSTDLARIQYVGAGGTRTLTTGSGTPLLTGNYSVRLSDSSNGIASNVPLTIAHATNTTNAFSSTTKISVIQSKLMNIIAMDGNRTLGSGQNTVCDDRNLTVMWRGLGEAQFGSVSIVLRRQGGFFGTQTLASVSNLPVSGNTSVVMLCPRTTTPSSSNSYAFQLTVNEPGGSDYTGNSPSFNVATAPTPTPSSTPSPTPSKTSSVTSTPTPSITPSPSPSSTPTPSPSQSNTPTPSITPTQSPTPSTTETARPSIDYAALARTAAESVDTTTPAIAGALGGIGGVFVLIGAVKWYQNRIMTQKRKRKLAMSAKWVEQAHATYGIQSSLQDDPELPSQQPSVVMYTVANMPPRKQDANSLTSIKKGFAPKPTSK
jgi:hypothetical protein